MSLKEKYNLMYANEKLLDAVTFMATSPNSLRDRIETAHAGFCTLNVKHDLEVLPENIRSGLKHIFELLTREKAKGSEADVRATLNRMPEQDAQHLAHKIFALFYLVHNQHEVDKAQR